MINLCSNAVKFTLHGEVIVSCSYTTDDKSDHTINVSVKDTCIGMNKAQQDKLFESFTQPILRRLGVLAEPGWDLPSVSN
jgi:two-component system sensor histidine kinase/response regulator